MLRECLMLLLIALQGCSATAAPPRSSERAVATVHSIALPGGPPGGVAMDYLAYDRTHRRVWVPGGNTGNVYVIDVADNRVRTIGGFRTGDVERRGVRRTVGPSSATVGDGVVYVGNRGDSSVCSIDAESLRIGACITLDSAPDGLAYVASTKEVWATAPRHHSIVVIDASSPGVLPRKANIDLDGQPEGFAVDDDRGMFYTNLEDKDRTLTIDVRTRQVTRTWLPGCGEDGPKGLAIDHARDILFVACRDRVIALDAGHDGKRLAAIEVGDGVDNIEYVEPRHELYAAAARAAKLVIARLDSDGQLTPAAIVETVSGARNAVATEEGAAYLTDSPEGRILVVAPVGSP